MSRYFIELAYNGTNYYGWQVQKKHVSVQQVVNEALATILRQPIETISSSRTDTGVHARQNFAHFEIDKDIPKNFLSRINKFLPKDIVIKQIFPVNDEVHARFDAVSRSYEYIVSFNKDPFLETFGFHYPYGKLDLSKMNKAAKLLLKYDDFTSFCKARTQVKTKICTITEAKWENGRLTDQLTFYISANRFLRGMVKGIVGSLIRVGNGKLSVDDLKKIIESKNVKNTDFSAPAHGLYLTKVEYPFLSKK